MADRRVLEDPHVLNPFGELIVIPVWLIRRLDRMKMLFWNRRAKHYQMTSTVFSYIFMSKQSSGFVHKPLRSLNIEHTGGRAKDSGNPNPILQALGADCRGLNVSLEQTQILEDKYRTVETIRAVRDLQAETVVKEIKSKRKAAD